MKTKEDLVLELTTLINDLIERAYKNYGVSLVDPSTLSRIAINQHPSGKWEYLLDGEVICVIEAPKVDPLLVDGYISTSNVVLQYWIRPNDNQETKKANQGDVPDQTTNA